MYIYADSSNAVYHVSLSAEIKDKVVHALVQILSVSEAPE
jgi:hypothetical protein